MAKSIFDLTVDKPRLGEVRMGRELGYKSIGYAYIWAACEDCDKERWEKLVSKKPEHKLCLSCSLKRHYLQKAKWDRRKDSSGYIQVWLSQSDFFRSMAHKGGRVLEHRLIVAKHLNRCLLPWEIVHHKNGVRDDNRFDNLILLPSGRYHIGDTQLKSRVGRLEKQVAEQAKRITLLEAENILLKSKQEIKYGNELV